MIKKKFARLCREKNCFAPPQSQNRSYGLVDNLFIQKTSSSSVVVEPHTMPPNSSAAKFHSLWVYHYTQVWSGNDVNPLEMGWEISEGKMVPLLTDIAPAPQLLLEVQLQNRLLHIEMHQPQKMDWIAQWLAVIVVEFVQICHTLTLMQILTMNKRITECILYQILCNYMCIYNDEVSYEDDNKYTIAYLLYIFNDHNVYQRNRNCLCRLYDSDM